RGNFFHRNLVVAMQFHVAAQLAQVLRQVVGKRIVVVEEQDHDCVRLCAASSARCKALDLFTDSSYSPSGVESATIPPPACTWATPFLMTMVRRAMHESRFPAKSKYRTPPA